MEVVQYESYEKDKVDNSEKVLILKIFILGLFLRVLMISLVYLLKDVFREYLFMDDFNYERYAIIYKNLANSLIDLEAFWATDKELGGVVVAQLFFRFNAILYYVTNSVVVLRLANAIFSSLTIVPIYLISRELFGTRAGKLSAILYACMPYHVMMSSFLFKDTLIALLMSASIYLILKYYKTGKLNIFLFLLLTIPQEWLRNGMPLFLFGVLGLAIFIRLYKSERVNNKILILAISVVGLVLFRFILGDNIGLLLKRLDIYMSHGRETESTISIVRIDSLRQLYKLPFTWIFSTLLPISFNLNITDWKDVLGILHYSYLTIIPGYFMYAFLRRKTTEERLVFYPILALHLLVIVVVLGIPRHYYFLHFYIIIFASAYISGLSKENLRTYILIVLGFTTLLFAASFMMTIMG